MNNINLIWLLTALFLSCSNKEPSAGATKMGEREVKEILVKQVSFSVLTFTNVECDNFESYFDKQYTSSRITDDKAIKEFTDEISSLELDTTNSKVDTRAKIIIRYNNGTADTLCVGKFAMLFRGEKVKYNDNLKSLILNELDQVPR